MVVFITFLRAIAACLITNSHYVGIYPTDIIANGGLLGDIIFFAVSGYCLYNVKGNFFQWYSKRLIRVYIPLLLITGIYLLLGLYQISGEQPWYFWFIYPTNYHFVASIVLLYIPFYFIMKIDKIKNNIPIVMIVVFLLWSAVYIFAFDKGYYHIDNVRENFIRFLFMESMLLGAYFRQNDQKYRNTSKNKILIILTAVILFVLYFASKIIFTSKPNLSNLQFINQIIIFVLLYFILRSFASFDNAMENANKYIKGIATFLADITLEIYLVQYALIPIIKNFGLPFPVNWLAVTAAIIVSAWILHLVCKPIVKKLSELIIKT